MNRDLIIKDLIERGRLRVDADAGLVYAPRSNTPDKPVGARTRKGYLRLCIQIDGEQKHFMVHRVVWVAVNGPVPEGCQVDHCNTVMDDNRISNLEAVPAEENMRRATAAGLCAGNGQRDAVRDAAGRFAGAGAR